MRPRYFRQTVFIELRLLRSRTQPRRLDSCYESYAGTVGSRHSHSLRHAIDRMVNPAQRI